MAVLVEGGRSMICSVYQFHSELGYDGGTVYEPLNGGKDSSLSLHPGQFDSQELDYCNLLIKSSLMVPLET